MKMMVGAFSLLLIAAAPAIAADKHFFRMNNTTDLIAVMEDPGRDVWQKRAQVLEALGDLAGKKIADIGAGSGYFTLPLAKKAGTGGEVFAVDIERKFLDELDAKATAAGLKNIRSVVATEDDPSLPPHSVHLAFMCNTFTLLGNRHQYLRKVRDILREGGLFVIISYNEDAPAPDAPPPQKRVSRDKTIREAVAAGFRLKAEHRFLPYQHFLIFESTAGGIRQ